MRMTISVAIFGIAVPIRKCSVFMHLDFVYSLSQKPLTGLQEKMETRIAAIHHAMTTPCTMFAMSLNLARGKTLR